jgi:hypothetical protein
MPIGAIFTKSKTKIDNFSGNDTFVFGLGFGKDTITDFHPGGDRIHFDPALTQFANFDAVMAHTADVNGNAVITYDAADTITLNGVTKALLLAHSGDFLV